MRKLRFLLGFILVVIVLGTAGVFGVFYYFGRQLPDYNQLADYDPPTTTRIHAGDGRLIGEYAQQNRVYVPIEAIPKRVVNAFLSAEDKNFYSHAGVDPISIARALVTNLNRAGENKRPVGASTITQQVAKNFLLTNELSIDRKIKEAILAMRIEQAFSKDRILELYLNEIYLGQGSYGVTAAALNYFDKALDELTVPEAAYLAGLPKAPNNYNPVRQAAAAKGRRDWVLSRMEEDGVISAEEGEKARASDLATRKRGETEFVHADWFAEEVRRQVVARYGDKALYTGGLSVRTTMEPKLQALADKSLRDGLVNYDKRHGWRGSLGKLPQGKGTDWHQALEQFAQPPGVSPWLLATVLKAGGQGLTIGLKDGSEGTIPASDMRWARRTPAVGDVIAVEPLRAEDGKAGPRAATYSLRQIPEVNGGLVALDPHTGRVLALSGGFSAEVSQFNRATQAYRQPGSSFKPFVYLTALEKGFTPSTLILDAPIELDQGPGREKWRPVNFGGNYLGPTTLRVGVEKSRNLMTVRLAQTVGMDAVVDYAQRFGVVDKMQPVLSMALGAGETTVLRITAAYGELVNGGKKITPSLIDRIQDRHGTTIYSHDTRACPNCGKYDADAVPELPDTRDQLADPVSAYQIVSILQGVVERGTARVVASIGKPLAGKTGTSNDSNDVWFVGFSPDLVVGVFVGYDQPRSLGDSETGGRVAAPIFKEFMTQALADVPGIPFRIPRGVRLVRVNPANGQPASPGDRNAIWEAFRPGTEQKPQEVLKGTGVPVAEGSIPSEEGASTGAAPGTPGLEGTASAAGTPGTPAGSTGASGPTPGLSGLY